MTKQEYASIHSWLRRNHGRPQICQSKTCEGKSNIFDWALKTGKEHARNPKHYLRLCRKCHCKYDMTEEKKKRILAISHTTETNTKRRKTMSGKPRPEDAKQKMSKSQRARNQHYCALGKCQSLTEWSEETGIKVGTLHARISYYGFTLEEALRKNRHERIDRADN